MAIDSPKDKLGRRRWWLGRQPDIDPRTGKPITVEPTPLDIALMKWIDRHGPLPTNYLIEAMKYDGFVSANTIKNRVPYLYHNFGAHGGCYIDIPIEQANSRRLGNQPVVIAPNKYTTMALEDEGVASKYRKLPGGPFVHQMMGATHGASIELATKKTTNVIYRDQDFILAHSSCPEATKNAPNPLKVQITKSLSLITDGLDALNFDKRLNSFYFREDDKSTETIRGKNTTLEDKVKAYITMYKNNIHQKHFGIPKFRVRILTNNVTHGHNILKMIAAITENDPMRTELRKLFLVNWNDSFKTVWKVPDVMHHLFTAPWHRVDDVVLISKV